MNDVAKLVILADGRAIFGVNGITQDAASEVAQNIRQWLAGEYKVLVLRGPFEVIDLRHHAIPLVAEPHGD